MLRSQMRMSRYDIIYTKCLETLSEDRDGWCRCDVRWWSDTRTWTRRRSVRDTSMALVPKCLKHTSAPTQKIRHFGTKDIVPNCLWSKVSWVRSVRTPMFPVPFNNSSAITAYGPHRPQYCASAQGDAWCRSVPHGPCADAQYWGRYFLFLV